ncbi:MAG: enoyl-CoA hydratase-related protein [Tepidiformaceae bacterium]
MADPAILYEPREGVAVITLNRPEVLNAFTPEALAELDAALTRAPADGLRAVLLTGAGRGFSAGMDLASIQHLYAGKGPDFTALLRDNFHPVIRRIRELEMPVIAAVNGVAAGAGMSLALACDIRIAADNARFATAFTKIGLVPDSGMAYTLPRLVGQGRARYLMLAGEPLDAAGALAIGLVDRVVPAAELASAAFAAASAFASGPTKAFAYTKQLVAAAEHGTFDEVLEREAALQQAAGDTTDHRGAVAAFLAKEPARFTGR